MDLPDWAFDVEALLRAHAEAYLPDVTPLIQALSQASAKSDRAQGERLETGPNAPAAARMPALGRFLRAFS